MTINIGQNWMTTVGGFLAGIPTIVVGSGLALPQRWMQLLSICGGVGVLLIGLAAKDFNTHSTTPQIAESTSKVAAGELPKV